MHDHIEQTGQATGETMGGTIEASTDMTTGSNGIISTASGMVTTATVPEPKPKPKPVATTTDKQSNHNESVAEHVSTIHRNANKATRPPSHHQSTESIHDIQNAIKSDRSTGEEELVAKQSIDTSSSAGIRQKLLMEKFQKIKIRPPKLRKPSESGLMNRQGNSMALLHEDSGTGANRMWKAKIGYSSIARPRSVNYTRSESDGHRSTLAQSKVNRDDQMELSGSEQQPLNLVLVHSYRRPAYERYAHRFSLMNGLEGQTLPSSDMIGQLLQQQTGDSRSAGRPAHIPKLLLPKANRPKMYSLNGFIPKPNVQKLAANVASVSMSSQLLTTVSPLTSVVRQHSLRKHTASRLNGLNGDQEEDKKSRKQVLHKEVNDGDDLNASGSATRRRQIMFSKRKGLINDNYLEEKPKTKKKRKLKAIDFQFPKANYPKELLESLKVVPEAPKLEEPLIFRKLNNNPIKSHKQDYPSYAEIPKTRFTCPDHVSSGVFADIDTQCQAWHMCQSGRKHSFLCANGTVFNERSGVCDWWYNVDCSENQLNIVKLTLSKRAESVRRADHAHDEDDNKKKSTPASVVVSSSESSVQPAAFVNSNHPVLNPILIRNRNLDLLNAAGSVSRGLRVRFAGHSLARSSISSRSRTHS